jgi:hypothetical protein
MTNGITATTVLLCLLAGPASGQSLYLEDGERAIEGSVAWSVGPFSRGVETFASVGLDGRVDIGLGAARYTVDLDDGSKSSFREYAPFVRFFPIKERAGGAPVSLAASAQIFLDDFPGEDSGKYVQLGTTVYKSLEISDRFGLQPFVGFAFVAESYTFGGGPADRAQYLTRDIGLHLTTATRAPWFLRFTLIEQSFRRETYRGARVSLVRRLG